MWFLALFLIYIVLLFILVKSSFLLLFSKNHVFFIIGCFFVGISFIFTSFILYISSKVMSFGGVLVTYLFGFMTTISALFAVGFLVVGFVKIVNLLFKKKEGALS